jgi:hypothetical protein
MKYYIHPYLVTNYPKIVEFKQALNPIIFNQTDLMYIDRMAIFGTDPNIVVLQPLLDYDKTKTYDFNQLIEARVREFVDLSKERNQPLQLLWSGGIDSTSIYCALMTYMKNPEDLIILSNTIAFREYPNLYNEIIQKHKFVDLSVFSYGMVLNELFTDNSIIISGEISDQLFMVDEIKQLPTNIADWNKDPWQLLLNPNFTEYHSTVEYFVNNYPMPITTVKQFLKAVRFNFKYQRVQLRKCLRMSNAILNKNLFHFYDTKEFNYYALSMPLEQLGDQDFRSPNNKLPLKQLILNYTKDQEYFNNKTKNAAILNYGPETINTIDKNWNKYFIPVNYTKISSDSNFIVDQPGIPVPVVSKYQTFSSNTGLVNWKIYKFVDAKRLDTVAKQKINFSNYICICGFKENTPNTLENFFTFFGNFIKYEMLLDSISIVQIKDFDKTTTIKLVGSAFTETYNVEVEQELTRKFKTIDYTIFEIVNPQTL